MAPPLGYIRRQDRSQAQHDAHDAAEQKMVRMHGLPDFKLNPGQKIMLTDVWTHPDVVADLGRPFKRFKQNTGSCIGVSLGDAIVTLTGTQRLLTDGATKAMLPWWPQVYGRTRYNEGDRGQGEGAMNSAACETMRTEGVLDSQEPGLPSYQDSDGLTISAHDEMAWSDGGSQLVTKWIPMAKKFPLGSAAPARNVQDIVNGIANGYPGYDGCDYYVGHGTIKGSGKDAYVVGHYDGQGGHSTCFLGAWMHPNDGLLLLYSNQWPIETYPADPAGAGPCCVWLPEREVARIWSDFNADAYLLSHQTYFPAQPKVPELFSWD